MTMNIYSVRTLIINVASICTCQAHPKYSTCASSFNPCCNSVKFKQEQRPKESKQLDQENTPS